MLGVTVVKSYKFCNHFIFPGCMRESASLEQFIRPGLCWHNLQHPVKESPSEMGRKNEHKWKNI